MLATNSVSTGTLPIGQTAQGQLVTLLLLMANCHGLIAGVTGKTMTLRHRAEQFSLYLSRYFNSQI